MNRERGQALIEAVLALPVCMLAAGAIVDCGIIVRDRLAVTEAAARGAEAHIRGTDAAAAARTAVPASLRDDVRIDVADDRVSVTVRSSTRLVRLPGGITHSSSARDHVEVTR